MYPLLQRGTVSALLDDGKYGTHALQPAYRKPSSLTLEYIPLEYTHSYSAWLFTLPAVPLALARAARSRPRRPVPYPYKTFTTYYLYYHTAYYYQV